MMIDDNLFYPSPILSKFFQIPLQVRRHYFFGAMQWPLTCSIPSHAPWAPPGEMLSDLMRCNFTNKVSDDLLRTLPHGPVYPTLQYWTGTILQYSISIISKLSCLNLKKYTLYNVYGILEASTVTINQTKHIKQLILLIDGH